MKKRKMLSVILAIVAAVSILLTGCGSKGGGSNKVQVGIVLPTKDEPRWLQDQAQVEKTNVETLLTKGIEVFDSFAVGVAQGQYLID